jgi:crotonobetainyl-CoA:carnitine CoA-transferase CaiB-like acyl-CoA transferase
MGALDGITVVDFGQWIAGPMTAMLLGDQGARVVRIDPPGGPRWRTPANAALQRGKECLVLDLSRETDLTAARRVIERADVLIENFRPGVMARLGLGPDDVTRTNPGLVYCSLPGFASDDPRARVPAWEGVLGAATGTYWDATGARFTALPISSTFGALAAAVAVAMALVARQRDSLGQRIEVPLFDATVLAIGSSGLLVDGKPDGARPDDPWGGQFECADGRWVRLSLATFRFVERFVAAAGRSDWIEKGYVHAARPGPLARGTVLRERQAEELSQEFRRRSAAEWEALGRRADVPITMVRSGAEWLAEDHPMRAGIVAETTDPELGRTRQPGLAVHLRGTPGVVRARRGESTGADAVIAAPPPRADDAVSTAADAPAALAGLRVVDLTQVLAGPTAARTLAEFGADVVKINNPREEGAGYRWQVHRYHTDVNRGKRTMLLDLKTPDGRRLLSRLIEGADVVLHNFRPGVAERLGVGYDDVKALRPDIVYGTVGFCGEGGPWETAPGYEPNAQAASGMMARMAGTSGLPAMQPFAPNDYATGLLGAFALGLALYHRRRTGRGQAVHTSLAAAATLLQSPYLVAYQGQAWNEPSGSSALGWSPLHRLYRASDGWCALAAAVGHIGRIESALELSGLAGLDSLTLESALAARVSSRPADEWVRRLTAAGVGAHAVVSAVDVMRDPWVVAHGLSITRKHPSGETVTTIGPPARLSRTPVIPGRPVATPGADAPEVLAEIGAADELPRLIESGAVALE